MSVAGISSSEDEDAGDAEDDEDTGSTVSVSQLSEENLSKRIATVKSMIEVAKRELFQYCYDLINFTPKAEHRSSNGCMASGGVWIGVSSCKLVYLD